MSVVFCVNALQYSYAEKSKRPSHKFKKPFNSSLLFRRIKNRRPLEYDETKFVSIMKQKVLPKINMKHHGQYDMNQHEDRRMCNNNNYNKQNKEESSVTVLFVVFTFTILQFTLQTVDWATFLNRKIWPKKN